MGSYKNDSLGLENLYQKTQYEMDIAGLKDEDPLVDVHHQFHPFQFAALPVPPGDNNSQAPSNMPAKIDGKNGDKHGKSLHSAPKASRARPN